MQVFDILNNGMWLCDHLTQGISGVRNDGKQREKQDHRQKHKPYRFKVGIDIFSKEDKN